MEKWDAGLLNEAKAPDTSLSGTGLLTYKGKTLSLSGALMVNYYVYVDASIGNPVKAEMLFWDGVSGELTLDNVSYRKDLIYNKGIEYGVQSKMFAARELDKTIYACAHVVDANGAEHYGEVISYSPEQYAANKVAAGTNEDLVRLMKAMVLYGENAKWYFMGK